MQTESLYGNKMEKCDEKQDGDIKKEEKSSGDRKAQQLIENIIEKKTGQENGIFKNARICFF